MVPLSLSNPLRFLWSQTLEDVVYKPCIFSQSTSVSLGGKRVSTGRATLLDSACGITFILFSALIFCELLHNTSSRTNLNTIKVKADLGLSFYSQGGECRLTLSSQSIECTTSIQNTVGKNTLTIIEFHYCN